MKIHHALIKCFKIRYYMPHMEKVSSSTPNGVFVPYRPIYGSRGYNYHKIYPLHVKIHHALIKSFKMRYYMPHNWKVSNSTQNGFFAPYLPHLWVDNPEIHPLHMKIYHAFIKCFKMRYYMAHIEKVSSSTPNGVFTPHLPRLWGNSPEKR